MIRTIRSCALFFSLCLAGSAFASDGSSHLENAVSFRQPHATHCNPILYNDPQEQKTGPISTWYLSKEVQDGHIVVKAAKFVVRGSNYQVTGWASNTDPKGIMYYEVFSGTYRPDKNKFKGTRVDPRNPLEFVPIDGVFEDGNTIFQMDLGGDRPTLPMVVAKLDEKGKLVSVPWDFKNPVPIIPSFESEPFWKLFGGEINRAATTPEKSTPSSPKGAKKSNTVPPRQVQKSPPKTTPGSNQSTVKYYWVSDGGRADPNHLSTARTTLGLNSFKLDINDTDQRFIGTAEWGPPPSEITPNQVFILRMTLNVTATDPWLRGEPGFDTWYSTDGPTIQTDKSDGKGFVQGRLSGNGRMGVAAGQTHPVPIFNSCIYKFSMGSFSGKTFVIAQSSNMGLCALYTYTRVDGVRKVSVDSTAANASAEIHGVTNPGGVRWIYPDGSERKYVSGGLTTLVSGAKLIVGPKSEVVIEGPNGNYVHIKPNSTATIENGKLVIHKNP